MVAVPAYVTLGVLAGALWAANNLLDKLVVPTVERRCYTVVTAVLSFVVSLAVPVSGTLGVLGPVAVPAFDPVGWGSTLLAGVVYVGAVHWYGLALSGGEVSRVAPLLETTAIFTLVLGVPLAGEFPTAGETVGVLLVGVGAVLASPTDLGFDFFDAELNAPFWYAVVGSLCFALAIVLTRVAVTAGEGFEYTTVYFWSRVSGLLPALSLVVAGSVDFGTVSRVDLLGLSVGELLNGAGLLVSTAALALGPAALVAAATSTTPLFVLVAVLPLSVVGPGGALDEEITAPVVGWKLAASALVLIGVYLVSGGGV